MKRFFALLMVCMISLTAATAEELPLTEFMKFARNPNPVSTYAALKGTIQHQRRGEKLRNEPLYFAIIITPKRMTGQVIIAQKEGYLIGQSRDGAAAETTVVPMPGSDIKSDRLGWMGLRASDLAMGFLFYPVVRELEPERVSIVPCRVVLLESPDKSEQVKVYIARDHYFPLKAEFFKKDTPLDGTPERTLETSGFTKKNGLYYTKTIKVSGPGWRSRVEFDADSAEVNELDPTKPPQIVKTLE